MLKVTMVLNNKLASPDSPDVFVHRNYLSQMAREDIISIKVEQELSFEDNEYKKNILGELKNKFVDMMHQNGDTKFSFNYPSTIDRTPILFLLNEIAELKRDIIIHSKN